MRDSECADFFQLISRTFLSTLKISRIFKLCDENFFFFFSESPSFILSQCKAVNRTVKLFWNPPPSAVDAYYLEANIYSSAAQPHEKQECETVKLSLGTTCKHSLECLHYDCRVIARVRASNRAGEGPFSEDIAIDTDKGKFLHY